ncbi:hypothetical protein [Kiloniella sp. b19]|uniref:hypothetical protein n=1 Tax=Kiloniella sp. GXU_MW_B19 TaxID=3141326 RepID=UPI0031D92F24
MKLSKKLSLTLTLLTFTAVAPAQANDDHVAPATEFANSTLASWVASEQVLSALREQNAKHAGLSQSDIDAMDQQWRSETEAGSQPMIDEVLGREISAFLRDRQEETEGLVLEAFVMDNKGLNVGQSEVTSDYWQGDEAKWQKTYGSSQATVFVDEVEEDESTQTFLSQVSMSIVDPDTGDVIGAITVGLDVEGL